MSFTLLLDSLSDGLSIPRDVSNLIKSYYIFPGINWNTFLLCCTHNRLFNISSQQCYTNIVANEAFTNYLISNIKPEIIINKCNLPKYISNRLTFSPHNHSLKLLSSSSWSFIFQFNGILPLITLFHSDLLSTEKCQIYQFYLKAFCNPEAAGKYIPSMIYSNINKTLYATNSSPRYSSSVYKLNLECHKVINLNKFDIYYHLI